MVSLMSLWLPIVLSAVIVFFVSSIIHMVLKYHANDFQKLPREDDVMDALRPFAIPPGDYCMPRPGSMKEMKEPAFIERRKRGHSDSRDRRNVRQPPERFSPALAALADTA